MELIIGDVHFSKLWQPLLVIMAGAQEHIVGVQQYVSAELTANPRKHPLTMTPWAVVWLVSLPTKAEAVKIGLLYNPHTMKHTFIAATT